MFVSLIALAARLLIAAYFLFTGFNHVLAPERGVVRLASLDVPFPKVVFWASLCVSLLCALLIALGGKARLAAWALAALTLASAGAVAFHQTWTVGTESFLQNLSMAGGLLFLALYGPGRLSLDGG